MRLLHSCGPWWSWKSMELQRLGEYCSAEGRKCLQWEQQMWILVLLLCAPREKLWVSLPEAAQRLMQDMEWGTRFHWCFCCPGERQAEHSALLLHFPQCCNPECPCLLLGSGCCCRILWALNWDAVRADPCYWNVTAILVLTSINFNSSFLIKAPDKLQEEINPWWDDLSNGCADATNILLSSILSWISSEEWGQACCCSMNPETQDRKSS